LKKLLLFLMPTILLFACESQVQPVQPASPPTKDEQETSLLHYFPQRPVEKFFQGIGNEFAQYKETFYENEGPYYPAIMDNGGDRFLRIYKVTEKEISIVYEQPDYYKDTIPTPSSLADKFQEQPILKLPLQVGQQIGDWKIMDLSAEVEVPMSVFSNVMIIEKSGEDGSIIRQYWAEKVGKIKDEFILKEENGDQFEITSELESKK
jgi:hypothetical protein